MAITDSAAMGWVDAHAAFLYYVAPAAGAIGVALVAKWLAARAERAARKPPPVVVAHAPGRLQRVLLAVDGSEHAANAVRYLLALRGNRREPRTPDGHPINVQRPVSGDVATFVAGATLDDYQRERSENALAPARAPLAAACLTPASFSESAPRGRRPPR